MTREQYEFLNKNLDLYVKAINGIGPNGLAKFIERFLPLKFFEFAPARHDVAFLRGGSNELRKREDNAFFVNCIHGLTAANATPEQLKEFQAASILMRIILYFTSKRYWNFRSSPIPWDDFIEILRESENEDEVKDRCFAFPDHA